MVLLSCIAQPLDDTATPAVFLACEIPQILFAVIEDVTIDMVDLFVLAPFSQPCIGHHGVDIMRPSVELDV